MLEELKSFQNDIIKKKYCLDNESSYEDILNNRFMPFFKEKINDDMKLKSIEDMLLHRRFIFGGSILRAFRSNKKMSLSNCYVLKFDGDSIEDIFSFLQKAARTMSYGGGVGEDISILRPKDAPVENAAKSSTGAVSFMPLIDLTTKTIGQKNRRGSNLCAIQDWHPDMPLFIKSKACPEEVFNLDNIMRDIYNISAMNISVKISDKFMKAVIEDGDWEFIYPDINSDKRFYDEHWDGDISKWIISGGKIKSYGTVKAKDLLMDIAKAAWECGDPGILFWDIHKTYSTTEFDESTKIDNVNPCLSGDTFIYTPTGLYTLKELANAGQDIAVYTLLDDKITIQMGRNPRKTGEKVSVYRVTLDNDTYVDCTADHKFMLENGEYREVRLLVPDDVILTYDMETLNRVNGHIVKSIKYKGEEDVYNITVDLTHNYIVVTGDNTCIVSKNCGEMPLHANSACFLGAFALHKYVNNQYTEKAKFDFSLFELDVMLAVEIMHLLQDENIRSHPLSEQRMQNYYERRMGIGLTGLADCLAMLGLSYSIDDETVQVLEKIMVTKCKTEWHTAVELAKVYGACSALSTVENRKKFLDQEKIKFYKTFLSSDFEDKFMQHGAIAIALSTVQPAGTLSIIADNCTSGIEPLFALSYTRKTRITGETVNIYHQPLLEYAEKNNIDLSKLTKKDILDKFHYIEAHDINWYDRLVIQSIIQKYVDTAISSTVNLPNSATVQDVYNVYMQAWELGLKGITVFRDGCKTGVLESSEKSAEKGSVLTKEDYMNIIKFCEQNNYNAETALAFIESYLRVGKAFNNYEDFSKWTQSLSERDIEQYDNIDKQIYQAEKNLGLYEIELLDEEDAVRHRVKWKNGIKVYINVTIDRDENKPLETFVSLPYEAGLDERGEFSSVLYLERKSDWDAINRLISVLLRYNIPLSEIIEQLQKSSYGMFTLSSLMKRVLSKYLITKSEDEEDDEDWDATVSDGLDDVEIQEIEKRINKINSGESKTYTLDEVKEKLNISPVKNGYNTCPECKNKSLIYEGGCWKCLTCFYSKCD